MRMRSNFSCILRIAQNRLTAVGRVLPITSQMASKSRFRSPADSACEFLTPSAIPMPAATPMAGLMKDVLMLGGYQEADIDFVANNPGMTLFHCHQQLHMDYGFMTLFDYR